MNETGKDEVPLSPDEQRSILDAALRLLSQSGLRANIIEKIAERCGVAAAQVYVHFRGADKLVEMMLDRELALMAGSVTLPELRFPGETLRGELEGLAHSILHQMRAHIGFLRTMLVESLRNEEFAAVFYRTFIQRGRRLFAEFLSARVECGDLKSSTDVEATAAAFLSALIFPLLVMELFGGKAVESMEDERLVKGLIELFLNGASPSMA